MFKPIFTILFVALLFCVGCEPPRVPTVAELTNRIWEPSSDLGGWTSRFCLLDNGHVLVIGNNASGLSSWSMKAGDRGFEILDTAGNIHRFDADFTANGELKLHFGEPKSQTEFTAVALGKLESGARYILEYVRDPINEKRPTEEVYIVFADEDRVRGFAGVNNFFGTGAFVGETGLTISRIGSTRRAGPHMEFENRFLAMLQNNVNTFLVFNNMLYMYDETELTMLMRYENVTL